MHGATFEIHSVGLLVSGFGGGCTGESEVKGDLRGAPGYLGRRGLGFMVRRWWFSG